ncbi:hypothetical protein BKA61DRAFT_631782 [Leptodontidium sp. MPI-SDFR-AT-0119]|nr:hypothetical protein BKA61DRAFT_631782 [Leptodontidium sp. MPI-SDFR-AT-0119]
MYLANLKTGLTHSCGSYNWIVQFIFNNGEEWMVRFPKGPKAKHPDEKVEAEVLTLKLIRDKTNIPVPGVKAWGLATENKFGLGPFIMMSVIKGVESILRTPDSKARLMREDIGDGVAAKIYRQVARFMLQLFKLDFPRIGSLSKSTASRRAVDFAAEIDSRPFTWRAHEALVLGGVDTYCPKATTFSSTADYFAYVAEGDLQQLYQQPSAVDDEADARQKLIYWEAFKSLIPRHVLAKYDKGPFKLIYDDFGPANMIVNNERELKIVGVIDWEWSYAGPCQLFSSPPHWLLLDSPNHWFQDDIGLATRYEKSLEMFLGILEEEEGVTLKDVPVNERLSGLMRECKEDGRMWFYCIIRQGFNEPDMLVWERLRTATPDFDQFVKAVSEEEITAFIKEKMIALAKYRLERDKKREWFDQVMSAASQD